MFLDEGTFIPSYYIGQEYVLSDKKEKYKKIDYSTLFIIDKLMDYSFGYICEDGVMPYLIKCKEWNGNILSLSCCLLDYYEQGNDLSDYIDIHINDLITVNIEVIDNDEIVFGDFSYPEKTHFYRISGPARIPIKNAVLNDSDVRLRVKPNLNCDVWTKLQKGTKVKIKDKSKESFEIAGESWYWYRVDPDGLPDGWVYGKYLDIKE